MLQYLLYEKKTTLLNSKEEMEMSSISAGLMHIYRTRLAKNHNFICKCYNMKRFCLTWVIKGRLGGQEIKWECGRNLQVSFIFFFFYIYTYIHTHSLISLPGK